MVDSLRWLQGQRAARRRPAGAIDEFTIRTAERSRIGRGGIDTGAILFVFVLLVPDGLVGLFGRSARRRAASAVGASKETP